MKIVLDTNIIKDNFDLRNPQLNILEKFLKKVDFELCIPTI